MRKKNIVEIAGTIALRDAKRSGIVIGNPNCHTVSDIVVSNPVMCFFRLNVCQIVTLIT